MNLPPYFPTPATDLGFFLAPHTIGYSPDGLCAKLELKLLDCLEAYGFKKSKDKCADIMYDMFECKNRSFQNLRAKAIRQERMKQYREGKLEKPFDEYPALDSYLFR